MKQARTRTESMVQRFSRKPISEGFDLWDRGYLLGALRLFTFKSETAPPFQLGPCLEALADICVQVDGLEDAREQYALAMEKYQMIQQPILAELMRVKLTELSMGSVTAQKEMEAYLHTVDPARHGGEEGADNKTKSGLARCYAYLAELVLAAAPEEEVQEIAASKAVEVAKLAVSLEWDRVHTGYCILGDVYDAAGDLEKANEAYTEAIRRCPRYVEAIKRKVDTVRRLGGGAAELLPLLNQAIEAHPGASLLREKAFALSETEGDAVALTFLEDHLSHPPVEEGESMDSVTGTTTGILLKAKAAILADGGRFSEALTSAEEAVRMNPQDEEAQRIVTDIQNSVQATV